MQYTRKRLQYHLKILHVWEMIFFFLSKLIQKQLGQQIKHK